jgi:hypothetical protein
VICAHVIEVYVSEYVSARLKQVHVSEWDLKSGAHLPCLFSLITFIMKFTLAGTFAFLALTTSVSALFNFDLTVFGERAMININRTPLCAKMCIFNPKWARTYAPECSSLPFGREYATRLCQNSVYQQMLDSCFKEKCNGNDRRLVESHVFSCANCRQGNWGKTLVRALGSMWNCHHGELQMASYYCNLECLNTILAMISLQSFFEPSDRFFVSIRFTREHGQKCLCTSPFSDHPNEILPSDLFLRNCT